MNIYKLFQTESNGYDTYDSAIVTAENEARAIHIHPDTSKKWHGDHWCWPGVFGGYVVTCNRLMSRTWPDPKDVLVELIGTAVEGTDEGVILASFNAG